MTQGAPEDFYIVVNHCGRFGTAFAETDLDRANYETTIADLMLLLKQLYSEDAERWPPRSPNQSKSLPVLGRRGRRRACAGGRPRAGYPGSEKLEPTAARKRDDCQSQGTIDPARRGMTAQKRQVRDICPEARCPEVQ